MMQLIEIFREEKYKITFASTATISERSEDLSSLGINVEAIQLNHPSFDVFIKTFAPTIVLFDRFITEEQFGWRVAENCPNALRILDTEDLHFLRKAREDAVNNGLDFTAANLYTETAKRELASILRCDLSLIISEYEMKLLRETFKIPSELLFYIPFMTEEISEEEKNSFPAFPDRNHFITVGNFLHAPNVDSVLWLKESIWPKIKSKLPQAAIHIYGAYVPQKILELHNEKEGFMVKGWVRNLEEVIQNARVVLAPLRFGAGLKGKIFDAMACGTPIITTSVGGEGMFGNLPIPGFISNEVDHVVKNATLLYTEEERWRTSQKNGFEILKERFAKKVYTELFKKSLSNLSQNLPAHRNNHFIGQILQHQTLQATKYFSKWIMEKESVGRNAPSKI